MKAKSQGGKTSLAHEQGSEEKQKGNSAYRPYS